MLKTDPRLKIMSRLDGHKTYSVEPLVDWLRGLDSATFNAVIVQSVWRPDQKAEEMRAHVLTAMDDPRFAKVRDGSTVASYLVKSPVPKLFWSSFARLLDPFAVDQLPKYVEQRLQSEAQRIAKIASARRQRGACRAA